MMRNLYLIAIITALAISSCKEMPKTDDVNGEGMVEVIDDNPGNGDAEIDNEAKQEVREQDVSVMQQKLFLQEKGFQVFEVVDEETNDSILMQQYYIAFLKSGPIRNQNEEEAKQLQIEHMNHLSKMYEMGFADISGPFGDDGEMRGLTIYNVPTLKMADSLAKSDPMVKAQRLIVEVKPWWAAKGFKLR